MMRAIEIQKPGAADVLRLCERALPVAKEGELRI